MATYLPLEYWILIPKGIVIVLSLVLAVKIYRLQNYLLNKIYAAAFVLWAGYITTISIIFWTAAESEIAFIVGNILHVVGLICSLYFIYALWMASLIIRKSTQELHRWPLIGFVITTVLAIVVAITQRIQVLDASSGASLEIVAEWEAASAVLVVTPVTFTGALLVVFPSVVALYAIISLTMLVRGKITDAALKQRMYLHITGFSLILVGWLFFVVIQALEVITIATGTIGHAIWASGLLCFWFAQKRGSRESQ